jgi:DNA invertase Pin-like site-specific DNA recombinase
MFSPGFSWSVIIMSSVAGIAEFERALIRDRTAAGRVAAKKRGVKFGRKPRLTPEQVVLALRLVDEGQSVPQVAAAFGVHETTIYRRLSAAV